MIVAHPLDADSRAVLPKGSSHLEGMTAISDTSKSLRASLLDKRPKLKCLL